jgi:hypothetical protein
MTSALMKPRSKSVWMTPARLGRLEAALDGPGAALVGTGSEERHGPVQYPASSHDDSAPSRGVARAPRSCDPIPMKTSSMIAICFVALAFGDAAARAERSPDSGAELALRVGVALPFGEVSSGSNLDSAVSNTVPLILEGGYRLDSNLFFGARFQYAFANFKKPNGLCVGNASCGGSDVALGVEALYRFNPSSTFAPWLGLGAGYEWLNEDITPGNPNINASTSLSVKGFQGLLQLGGDVRVTNKLVLGPFIEAAFGRYESVSNTTTLGNTTTDTSADITNTAWHTWLTLGIRGAFGF